MADIAKDLRRFAVEVATELSDETAAITVAVLTDAADEIERLQGLIDAYAQGYDRASNDHGAALRVARKALLAAATPQEQPVRTIEFIHVEPWQEDDR